TKVQAAKKATGHLDLEEAKSALTTAVAKAEELADKAGVHLDSATLPGRGQSVFARFKAGIRGGNNSNEEVLK
ncbi:MAG: hypothetical protein FWG74_03720, partial [Planctomycetes bacterium]|nr:hypothetical protein [Planctomycetota bacterium]